MPLRCASHAESTVQGCQLAAGSLRAQRQFPAPVHVSCLQEQPVIFRNMLPPALCSRSLDIEVNHACDPPKPSAQTQCQCRDMPQKIQSASVVAAQPTQHVHHSMMSLLHLSSGHHRRLQGAAGTCSEPPAKSNTCTHSHASKRSTAWQQQCAGPRQP